MRGVEGRVVAESQRRGGGEQSDLRGPPGDLQAAMVDKKGKESFSSFFH